MSDFEDVFRRIVREEVRNALADMGLGRPTAEPRKAALPGSDWAYSETATLRRGHKSFVVRPGSPVRCEKDSGKRGYAGVWVVVGIKVRGEDTNVELRQEPGTPSRTFRAETLSWVNPKSKDGRAAIARMRM